MKTIDLHKIAYKQNPPPHILTYGDVDLSPLKPKGEIPEHTVRAIIVDGARIHIGTGLVTNDDDSPVRHTLYLNRKYHDEGSPITNEHVSMLPRTSGEFAILHNITWENHYHVLIQTAVSVWLLAHERPDLMQCALLPPMSVGHRRLLKFAGLNRAVYMAPQTSLIVDSAVLVETSYMRTSLQSPSILRAYGADVANCISDTPSAAGGKVYLSRRDSNRRRLANEEQIEKIFKDNGFTVVTMAGKNLDEQIRIFRDAEIVVSPHGAGLANAVFSTPGTKIVELTASAYLNPCFLDIANAMDHDFEMHVFETPTPERRHLFDWTIDPAYASDLAKSLAS